jgi:small basic protein
MIQIPDLPTLSTGILYHLDMVAVAIRASMHSQFLEKTVAVPFTIVILAVPLEDIFKLALGIK